MFPRSLSLRFLWNELKTQLVQHLAPANPAVLRALLIPHFFNVPQMVEKCTQNSKSLHSARRSGPTRSPFRVLEEAQWLKISATPSNDNISVSNRIITRLLSPHPPQTNTHAARSTSCATNTRAQIRLNSSLIWFSPAGNSSRLHQNRNGARKLSTGTLDACCLVHSSVQLSKSGSVVSS